MKMVMRLAALLVSALTACATATATAPRFEVWVSYGGVVDSHGTRPTEGGVIEDHGNGYIPSFRIRLRSPPESNSASRDGPVMRSPMVEIEPRTQASVNRGAALLLGIVNLGIAWDREGPLEVDMQSDQDSPAVQVCRSVEVQGIVGTISDRCTISAILDETDGWPITARINRSVAAANGVRVRESITLERIPRR